MRDKKWGCGCAAYSNNFNESADCPDCKCGAAVLAIKIIEAEAENNWLPTLSGSPRQKKWAMEILIRLRSKKQDHTMMGFEEQHKFEMESLDLFIAKFKRAADVIDRRLGLESEFREFNDHRQRAAWKAAAV